MENRRLGELIAAVATAPGRGGIGIVRLSGADLAPLCQCIAGLCPRPRMAARATFRDAGGARIDEGLVLFFPAPNSYTGEDVLELQGHGGPVVLQLLLQRCLELGAQLAEPGEFTRRAFLNGKLDLAQAEAVADLIEASTAAAARSAVRSLAGEFSAAVDGVSQQLIDLRMLVEGSLDFPEEDVDFLGEADAAGRLRGIRQAVASLQQRARQGSLLRSGLRVVLAGQPNVGKSSLLNRLAGEERAIVTAVAGTTRDALRETISIHGIPLHVVDTAGLRDTADEVERIGVSRAWQEIAAADVVLLVLDARAGETEADREIIARLPTDIPRIDILNKIDLAGRSVERRECDGRVTLGLSAKTGAGVEHLESELLRVAGWLGDGEDVFMARARHLEALSVARRCLDAAWAARAIPDLLAEELRLAHDALACIVGKFSADDLLGEIFSRFCIGK